MSSASVTGSSSELNYLNCEKGLWSWLTTVDHKRIALMYLYTITLFFFVGGLAALAIRLELFASGNSFLHLITGGDIAKAKNLYNILFTLHGVIMIFLFIVPGIPAVMGNWLLPIMIGAKDVAFPRLNLLSYYIYIVGAIMALISLFSPIDTGWTFYAPYSLQSSSAVVMMTGAAFVLGFSSILTGLNFIVTVHQLRAPGMTWGRLPVFVWAIYSTSVIQTLATPVVGMTLALLIVERVFGIGVFDPARGGDPVFFEHMFWFYSHPVVYIMVLPAFGVVGEIIPVFSRKPIFGYKAVVGASLGIAAFSFIVWAHHMLVAGISDFSAKLFSVITFGVAIPTAVKVFNWVSTMYRGSIKFETPMLYAMAFVFLFMVAGTTGIYLATLAVDVFYHDTYFVVAHFHYTIQGGAVIGLIAALHFWFPKMFGTMYNQTVSKIAFWMIFIGFNGTFLPQFVLGMHGAPRRYYDHLPEFAYLHSISTVFAFLNAAGYGLALLNLFWAMKFSKNKASDNPWNSLSLEWKTATPPITENFVDTPVITEGMYEYGEPVKGGH
jgi:cytochrome c oxidase subunit 1